MLQLLGVGSQRLAASASIRRLGARAARRGLAASSASGEQARLAGLLGRLADGEEAAPAWLRSRAAETGLSLDSAAAATAFDEELDQHASSQRTAFNVPLAGNFPASRKDLVASDEEAIYLCGHSLGLQPRRTRDLVMQELDKWAAIGVEGHFSGDLPWAPIDEFVVAKSASLVGALESEVAIMNGLTTNLHLLMVAFYRPEGSRRKILYQSDAFPSDFHAFESQALFHGFKPKEALLPVTPRQGEDLLRTEDIIATIEEAGDSLSVVVLETVAYYTGQYLDVPAITAAAQKVGAKVILQCAHAAGNVDLKLHDWGVDGACWCSYKYLNSGPGGIAGFFLHEKHHASVAELPKFAGWWGHRKETRFDMAHVMDPLPGAKAFQLSNPPVLQTVSLLGSLDVFTQSTMREIRGRSMLLTAYMEMLLRSRLDGAGVQFRVITPTDAFRRGAALSLKFEEEATCLKIFEEVAKRGVIIDFRKPNVLRVAPAPLYNNFRDVFRFARALGEALDA